MRQRDYTETERALIIIGVLAGIPLEQIDTALHKGQDKLGVPHRSLNPVSHGMLEVVYIPSMKEDMVIADNKGNFSLEELHHFREWYRKQMEDGQITYADYCARIEDAKKAQHAKLESDKQKRFFIRLWNHCLSPK